jgi:hypothetical protein
MSEPRESVALPAGLNGGPSDFDFWLGSWRGTWSQGEATNLITKDFGDHVIVEQFTAEPPDSLRGMSVSVFDSREACWKQTWVDDTGSYLDFRGGLNGAEMHLSRELIQDGEEWLQRMVFCNIEDDRFDWLWQRTRGHGSWETLWEISYERRPSPATSSL